MKVINVGVIGHGRSGRDIHCAWLAKDTGHYKIAAVADSIAARRKEAAEKYQCDVYGDYRELFKRRDIDLIVNATFSQLHVPITLEILKAGYNALCEKPIASSARDVDRLVAAAKKAKKVFAIFQQARFAPYFLKVREVIESGALGRIVQISINFNGFMRRWDWQTMQSYNGGSLLNTGPHPLDQALVLFGKGMPEVRCFMDRVNTFGNAEDHVKLILSGKGHPLIDLEVSCCCAYPTATYNVYGTRGGMKATTGNTAEWKYFKLNEAPKQTLVTGSLSQADGLPTFCSEKLKWHEEKWPAESAGTGTAAYSPAAALQSSNMTGVFYSMLYKSLTAKMPLKITPEQVRRQIAVIAECRRQNPHIYRKR